MNRFRRLFNNQSKTITSAAVILGLATLASRILGLIRERLFAHFFGAGDIIDMYVAAFRIPDLVFVLLVTGALSAGFIPVFTGYVTRRRENEAWQVANDVLNVMLVSVIGLCLILFFLAPILVPLIVPGFDKAKTEITVNLSRILFLSPILLGISSLFSGILNSFKRFFVVSLAPILYNIGIIIGILFFVRPWGVYGLVLGVILGTFLHLLIQVPSVIYSGFRYQWIFNLKQKGFRRILKMMPPRTMALFIAQINLLIITIIASTLPKGSLAVFNYANNLASFPIAIFGLSFAVAAFPTLAGYISQGKKKKFIHSFAFTLRQILFFIIPASVLMLVLRAQIVRVILGTGMFDWQATKLTLRCLGFFSFSLFAQAAVLLLDRAFYALQNTKIPLLAGLISAIVNIAASLILSRFMGIAGLALAFSIASFVNALLLYLALQIKIGNLGDFQIFVSILKIGLSSVIAGLITYGTLYLIEPFVNTRTGIGILTQGLIAGLIGIAVYFVLVSLIKCREMAAFGNLLKTQLVRMKKPPTEIGDFDHKG